MPSFEILKASTLILLLASTTVAAAQTRDVTCPPVEKIYKAVPYINLVMVDPDNKYFVMTEQVEIAHSNLFWYVGVSGIVADTQKDALNKAKEIASKASNMLSEIPSNFGIYYCYYNSPAYPMNKVVTIAYKR